MKTLTDYGLTVTPAMTTPSRAGKKPRPVWNVTGNVYGYEEIMRDMHGRKFHGVWSFFSDPTDRLLVMIEHHGRASFAEQVEAKQTRAADRAERYEGYAENAAKRSAQGFKTADTIASSIPMGQPILVGHHSEKGHRADLKRIDNGMRKGVEEAKKAGYLAGRAEAAARNAEDVQDMGFMVRRLDEAQAAVRDMERKIAKHGSWPVGEAILVQDREKATYWAEKIRAAGGAKHSQGTIKVGDFISKTDRFGKERSDWFYVERVNAKTVTGRQMIGNWNAKAQIPYAEVAKVVTPTADSKLAGTAREVYGFKGTYPA